MLFEIKSAPMQETKDGEKGVRLIFTCVDVADPRSTAMEVIVMWVVNLEEVLPIARLPGGTGSTCYFYSHVSKRKK